MYCQRMWHFASSLLTLSVILFIECEISSLSEIPLIDVFELQLVGRREQFFQLGCLELWCNDINVTLIPAVI